MRDYGCCCRIRGCGRPAAWKKLRLCNAHGLRWYRYGSVFPRHPVAGARGLGRVIGRQMSRNGTRRWYRTSRAGRDSP